MLPAIIALAVAQPNCAALDERIAALTERRLLGLVGAASGDLEVPDDTPSECRQFTPLMRAADLGDLETVHALIALGARVTASFTSPLFHEPTDARCLALARNHTDVVAALDDAGAVRLGCTHDAVLLAAMEPSADRIGAHRLALLEHAVRSAFGRKFLEDAVTAFGQNDATALYLEAVRADDLARLRAYQEAGLKLRNPAPLILALRTNRAPTIPILIAAGAGLHGPEIREAISHTFGLWSDELFEAVLATGWRGDDASPVILWAMRWNSPRVPRLIALGFDVDAGAHQQTPLSFAANERRCDWTRLLRDAGARGTASCRRARGTATRVLRL